jgi:voltage-gated potassium channel
MRERTRSAATSLDGLNGGRGLWARGPRLPLLLLLIILAGGTVGYVVIEGWEPWDAFYMTVTTITTVGYRDVHPLSRSGQVFTIVLLLSGVGTVFYAATTLATIVVREACSEDSSDGE